MFRHLTTVTALTLLLGTAPGFAQNTEEAASEGKTTAENVLDLGQPVDGGPKLGDRYSKEKIGDWDLACIKTDTDNDPCSMLQILTDESGNAVAEVSMFQLAGGGKAVAGATVIVPLETLLPAQLTIAVDGGSGKRYNYSFCNPIGCIAQIGLTAEDVAAFKRGNTAKVTLVPAPAPDQKITLNMSLTGFTASYDKTDKVKGN